MSLFPGISPSLSLLKHFVNIKDPFDLTYFVICTVRIVQCYNNTAEFFSYDFQISKAPILATIQYDD